MSATIVSTQGEALALPGVYALEQNPPTPAARPGLDWVGLVGSFAWGPVNTPTVVDLSNSRGGYLNVFAPGGLGTTHTGHRALMKAACARLKIVRVGGTSQATATMVLNDGTGSPVSVLTVTAKYPGSLPITITIAAADDGVSTHFNLTATAGTYSERYPNLSVLSGSNGVVLGDQTNSLLLAALAVGGGSLTSSTRPVNGTYTLGASGTNVTSATAGADGTPGTTHYTGTAGSGDAGIAKFEGDPDVTIVAVDDCGDSNRVAINTALVAHAVAEQRIAVINGNSGVSISAAITYVGTNASAYRSERAIFAWPWVYVKDEGGTERLVPPSVMLAGALSRMPRHLGTHWKDPRNTVAYSGISRLEYAVSRANLILAQNAGIECIVPAGDYYAPKSGVTTSLSVNQTQVSRRRIADFLMRAVSEGQEAYEGGPIDPATRSRQLSGVKRTLQAFVDAGRRGEAETTEAIDAFSVETASSAEELAAGVHKIAVRAKTFATQDVILFLLSIGPTVAVTEATPANA